LTNQNGGAAFSPAIGGYYCLSGWRGVAAVKNELAAARSDLGVGYTLQYYTHDNYKERPGHPRGLSQDFAGVGGDVKYLKTTGDVKLTPRWLSDTTACCGCRRHAQRHRSGIA